MHEIFISMKIAIIGYGKMGKRIHALSEAQGHEISYIISSKNQDEILSISPANTDVAIDFSVPEVAFRNITSLLNNHVAVVSGTTGWLDQLDFIRNLVKTKNGTFFYAPNFSYSLYMFNAIQMELAKLMNGFSSYNITMEEIHHTEKKDSPSGTAIRLAKGILENLDRKSQWINQPSDDEKDLQIISKRKAGVPGIHEILYESEMDSINLVHTAKNRDVFVIGAIDAAEFVHGKKGIYGMEDLVSDKLN